MEAFRAEREKVVAAAKQFQWRWLPPLDLLAQAMMALLEGRLDEVEPLASRAVELGGGLHDIQNGFVLLLFWLRFEQGRLDEVRAILEALVAGYPDRPVTRSLLALLYAELDQRRAADLLDGYAAQDFEGLPWGAIGPIVAVALSYTAARLGRAADAAVLYGLLKPFEGHLAVVGTATLCLGPFDHYLGMLAACRHQWQRADFHYEEAIALEERTGAPAMLARTRLWQAKALLANTARRQRTRTVRLATIALAQATDLGMTGVAVEAREVVAAARASSA
jgi:hypothetical protein